MNKQMESIKKMKAERRIRRFAVTEDVFLDALRGAVRINKSFPDDSLILSVHHDCSRGGFIVAVIHPSFDKVPQGEWPPEFDTIISTLSVKSMKKVDRVYEFELADPNVL